jgi:hypothetical protein
MDDVEDVVDFPRDGVVLGECDGADVWLFMLKVVADCADGMKVCKEGLLMDGCAAAVVLGALVGAPAGRFFAEGVVMEVVVEIGRVG